MYCMDDGCFCTDRLRMEWICDPQGRAWLLGPRHLTPSVLTVSVWMCDPQGRAWMLVPVICTLTTTIVADLIAVITVTIQDVVRPIIWVIHITSLIFCDSAKNKSSMSSVLLRTRQNRHFYSIT